MSCLRTHKKKRRDHLNPSTTLLFPLRISRFLPGLVKFFALLMKWKMDMEMEEVEAVLEKIWDLHDKLSDAIHSISRSHFLHSVKSLRNSNKKVPDGDVKGGFVYVKDFPIEEDDDSAIHEAKSLNSIRTALENLEDQLEFFHTVQTQQRAERDAAIARLEQSRIVLALRLADHHGNKYKVIEEARAFVGEVQNHTSAAKRSNILVRVFLFARKSLKVGGLLGNAGLFALSMLALLQLHQGEEHIHQVNRNVTKVYVPQGASSNGLDVLSARG